MDKITLGVASFQQQVFPLRRSLFERLAHKQAPMALFITCSDSRIDPNLLTQTEPGDLFLIRNAGNIIPPYGAANGGEGATVEYALSVLHIREIIVCGHSNCGAMQHLMRTDPARQLPAVRTWFAHAETTRRVVTETYPGRPPESLVDEAIEQNVLVQIDHLRTHASVASALRRGNLRLHGWVYDIPTGEVRVFHPVQRRFVPLAEEGPLPIPSPASFPA
jgi:carbonic anhydrase